MITLETALLSALSIVTSALAWATARLWQRSEECETDRKFLREQLVRVLEGQRLQDGEHGDRP